MSNEAAKSGPSEGDIATMENKLNFKFPKSYKSFLKNVGTGTVGNIEVYGYVSDMNRIPSVVKATLNERKYNSALNKYIVIANIGNGDLYLLNESDAVYFYQHDNKKITNEGVTFNKWLEKQK